MTKFPTNVLTRGLSALLAFFTVLAISAAAFAMEPDRDHGRIDFLHPDILLTQIAWQDRSEAETSRYRLNGNYILPGLERSHGWRGNVGRSNLFNSPAARVFTQFLTGRRGH